MAVQDTLSFFSRQIAIAFEPLQKALEDDEFFASYMQQEFGWNIETIPAPFQSMVVPLNHLFEILEDDIASSDTPLIIADIAQLMNAIRGLSTASSSDFPSTINFSAFSDTISKELIQHLFVDYFIHSQNKLGAGLRLAGAIRFTNVPASGLRSEYIKKEIAWNDIAQVLEDPLITFKNAYNWGDPSFKSLEFLHSLYNLGAAFSVSRSAESVDEPLLTNLLTGALNVDEALVQQIKFYLVEDHTSSANIEAGIGVYALPQTVTALPGIAFLPFARGAEEESYHLSDTVSLVVASSVDLDKGPGVLITPGDVKIVSGLSSGTGETPAAGMKFKLGIVSERNGDRGILLGTEDGSRIDYKSLSVALGAEISTNDKADFTATISIKEGKFVVTTGSGDSFIQRITSGNKYEGNFDLEVNWSAQKGFYFGGSSALEISIPAHITLGPVEIQKFVIGLQPSSEKIITTVGAYLKAQLNPLTIIVQDIGIKASLSFPPDANGNLGPIDIGVGFKAPNGLGLSVDSGGLKGGGFLKIDQEKGEYFGALELEFNELFSLKAFGIVNTRMPDGSEGFSLLILITAEFTPVQLGFGFTLNGVGGLLGLNRTARLDILREGVRTNAIKSILFPEDIIGNIDRIVSDVKAVFPVQRDNFVLCPMGKLGWGTPAIITLEVGLLLEIPVTGFAILGVLKAVLPQEDVPLLKLQINFIGIIDFENRTISFDGTLYDSRLLAYTLSGDMAFRLSYGDNPLFVLSVGGFHPAFREAPSDLQHMQRLTVSLLNTANARIMVQTYFAVTSNTVQNGARAELFAGSAGGFNILGYIGYDVLFQFEPFRLVADFNAALALRRGTSVLMGISASGQLSGPSPWDAHGRASISLFFFSVSVSFHETWGDTVSVPPAVIADVTQMLSDALQQESNWQAALPLYNKLQVTVRTITSSRTVVHPFGILTFSQRIVPLNINIEKFGNQQPDTKFFAIKTSDEALKTEEASESFAPANFFKLKDAEKLSRPSFEPMSSGFRITGSSQLQAPLPVNKSVNYEISYLGKRRTRWHRGGLYGFAGSLLSQAVKASSVSRSSLSAMGNRISVNRPEEVLVPQTKYAVASTSDMKLYGQQYMAASYTEAMDHYHKIVNSNPAMAEQLQVVADYEINTL